MKESEQLEKKLSVRMPEDEYEEFKKLCHLEFSGMAKIARGLILEWMTKKRKQKK